MPAACTMAVQRSMSEAMRRRSVLGAALLGAGGTAARSARRRRSSSSASAASIAAATRSTTAGGVPRGAAIAFHTTRSKAGTPASAKVGTSGSCGTRAAPVTASATAVRPRCAGIIVTVWSITASTTPAARSFIAGPAPR